MMKLQYGFLRLGYFVTGRYCTTIQYTANLAELRMDASRSVTLWDGIFCMPWSFWHAFSRSLVASSTSLVVTWHRVNWVMDFARRWTAASLIGVGRSIPKAKLSTSFSVDVKPLGIQLTLTVLQPWSRKGMGRCGESYLAGRKIG